MALAITQQRTGLVDALVEETRLACPGLAWGAGVSSDVTTPGGGTRAECSSDSAHERRRADRAGGDQGRG